MTATGQSGQHLSVSMFYMWRCVIAIAHADGMVQAEERAYLERVFTSMDRAYGLSDEQKKTFADDIANAKKIADLLPHINEPAARAQLIYFGGLLAHADGAVSPSEDAILRKLHADQMASLDMDALRADVKNAIAESRLASEQELAALRPKGGLVALLDALLLRLGIDIIR